MGGETVYCILIHTDAWEASVLVSPVPSSPHADDSSPASSLALINPPHPFSLAVFLLDEL